MTKKNLLIKEKSPYLLQHAENPVNWYPWGEKAFKTAKKEDKPVFLSIGYSTCHWCHVMARESFEDKEVATIINRVFIPIKVDREERPEIDKIYMNVCQAMTGSGGWPLTIFLTPDKKPFYAATYIPKNSKYGRKGIIDLITEIEKLWKKRREEVIKSARNITERLKKKEFITEQQADEKHLEATYVELKKNYDNNYGGFGHSTKFPTAHKLLFLLRYWKRTEEEKALKMVEETLEEIRKGGIYDHLGLGFHRYAMDRKWLIPHFEKMLYDQALLAYTYIEAYQASKKDIYKKISEEILTYLKTRLYSSEGAFYAAENAESEGQEGKYYLWEKEEIKKLLNKREMNVFNEIYNLNNINEFTNENINKYTLSLKNIEYVTSNEYKNINDKLLKHRDKRVKPSVDDKILTDWNGLVMAALARAGGIYNNKNYINTAEKLYSFIEKNIIIDDGKLYHCYCKGEASVEANIDDYSYLIWALLELYEATFNYKYIKKAEKLLSYTKENFWDEKDGGFYFASKNKKDLIIKQKEIYDGALPSGNSVICWNLIRLAHITDNMKYLDMAEDIVATFLKQAINSPSNYCQYFCALDSLIGPFKDIFITGYKNDKRTEKMLNTLTENYIPKKTIVFQDQEYDKNKDQNISKYAMTNGKATAYICKNFTCSKPTNNVEEMLDKINN